MKTFVDYLTESKKTYAFKIKIAGDLEEGFDSKLKDCLDRFSLSKIGQGKSTPIQELPLDFPEHKNCKVTIYEIEVNYPTTTQVLTDYIASCCGCSVRDIRVRTGNEPSEEYQTSMGVEPQPVLGEEEPKSDGAQDLVGQKRVSDFLKELEADSKTRKIKDQPTEKAEELPEPSPGVSPIGSKVQKGK
jgi:hypothetical protein